MPKFYDPILKYSNFSIKNISEQESEINIKLTDTALIIEITEPRFGKKISFTLPIARANSKEALQCNIPGYDKAKIILHPNGTIALHDMNGKANLSFSSAKNIHLENINLEGNIRLDNAPKSTLSTHNVHAQTLRGQVKHWINRGDTECNHIEMNTLKTVNQGKLYGTKSFKLLTRYLDNRNSQIYGGKIDISMNMGISYNHNKNDNSKNDSNKNQSHKNDTVNTVEFEAGLDNRKGEISSKGSTTIFFPGRINNRKGWIGSTSDGHVFVKSLENVDNLDGGCIHSEGKVKVQASAVSTDDNSCIHGDAGTTVLGLKKIRQETPLAGQHVLAMSKYLDLNTGVFAAISSTVKQTGTQVLKLKHPMYSQKGMVKAHEIWNYTTLLGERFILSTTGEHKPYTLRNYGTIGSTVEDLFLYVYGLAHENGVISSTRHIVVPQLQHLRLQSPIAARGDFLTPTLAQFEYEPKTLDIEGKFRFALTNGMTFSKPLSNTGSMEMILDPKATHPLNIQANITCGNNEGDSSTHKVGHLSILSPAQPLILGNRQNNHFVALDATGRTFLHASDLDLQYCRVTGFQKVHLKSETGLQVGRLLPNKNAVEVPSAISSRNLIDLEAGTKALLYNAEIRGGGLKAKANEVDCIGTELNFDRDALIDTPLFQLRLSYIERSEYYSYGSASYLRCTSKPSSMTVEGSVTTTGRTKVIGSKLQYRGDFQGSTPERNRVSEYEMRRPRWFNGYVAPRYGTVYLDVMAQGSPMIIDKKIINISGNTFAPLVHFKKFEDLQLGLFSNMRLPAPKPFKQVYPFQDFFKVSSLRVKAPLDYHTYFKSVVPKTLSLSFVPPVIAHPNGNLSTNSKNLRIDPSIEDELNFIQESLQEARGYVFENATQTVESLLQKYRLNAQEYLMKKSCSSGSMALIQLNKDTSIPEDVTEPMLFYCEITKTEEDGTREAVLTPVLVVPKSWDNLRMRDHAGLTHAFEEDVIFEGASKEISSSHITGNVEAQNNIRFENMHINRLEQRVTSTTYTYTNYQKKRKLGFGHSKQVPVALTETHAAPGANLKAGNQVSYNNIDNNHQQGGLIQAGKGGVKHDNVNNNVMSPIVTSKVNQHHSEKFNSFSGSGSLTHHLYPNIHPPRIESRGAIHSVANNQNLESAAVACDSDALFHANHHSHVGDTIVKQDIPPVHSNKGLISKVTQGSREIGTTSCFNVKLKLTLSSGGTMFMVAPKVFSGGTHIESEKTCVIEKQVLHQHIEVKSSGIKGIKYQQSKTNVHNESGKVAQIISTDSIVMLSKTGNILVFSPQMIALAGDIKMSAPEGDIIFEQATFLNDITQEDFSICQSYFGSEALDAVIKGHFKEAAKKLLDEFPVFHALDTLKNSEDKADKIGNSIRMVYQTYKLFQSYASSNNVWEFMQSQFLTPKVRVGVTKSKIHYTTAMLTWLQAFNITMNAKNIQIKNVRAQCENLSLEAERKIGIEAGQTEFHSRTTQTNVAVGYNLIKMMPTLDVDYAKQETKATQYLTSHITVANQTTLTAGDNISLKGVCLETLKALISTTDMTLQSLQDKTQTTSFNASVSSETGAKVGMGKNQTLTTQEQTGIHAKETMLLNIKNSLSLIAARLTTGADAKPIALTTPAGEALNLYPYALSNINNDSVFLALGIPRKEALEQLLKEMHDEELRNLVADEIEMTLLTNSKLSQFPNHMYTEKVKCLCEKYEAAKRSGNQANIQETLNAVRQYCKDPNTYTKYLTYLLQPNLPIHYISHDKGNLLDALAKITRQNIHIWLNIGENHNLVHSYSPTNSTSTIHLSFKLPEQRFDLLSSQPGLIRAANITHQTLTDIDKAKEGYVTLGQSDFGYKAKNKETKVRSVIGENIAVNTQSDISGLKRNPAQSRETTKDRKTNYNLPIGATVFLANETAAIAHRFVAMEDIPARKFSVNDPGTLDDTALYDKKRISNQAKLERIRVERDTKEKFISEARKILNKKNIAVPEKHLEKMADEFCTRFLKGRTLAEVEPLFVAMGKKAIKNSQQRKGYRIIKGNGKDEQGEAEVQKEFTRRDYLNKGKQVLLNTFLSFLGNPAYGNESISKRSKLIKMPKKEEDNHEKSTLLQDPVLASSEDTSSHSLDNVLSKMETSKEALPSPLISNCKASAKNKKFDRSNFEEAALHGVTQGLRLRIEDSYENLKKFQKDPIGKTVEAVKDLGLFAYDIGCWTFDIPTEAGLKRWDQRLEGVKGFYNEMRNADDMRQVELAFCFGASMGGIGRNKGKSTKQSRLSGKNFGLSLEDQKLSKTLGDNKIWSTKGRLKSAQLPTEGKMRFVPPENYNPAIPLYRGPDNGYLDRFGNEWIKGPSRTIGELFEWDVKLTKSSSKKLDEFSRDGKHMNVSLKGRVTHR